MDRAPVDVILPTVGFLIFSLYCWTFGGGVQVGVKVGPEKMGPSSAVFVDVESIASVEIVFTAAAVLLSLDAVSLVYFASSSSIFASSIVSLNFNDKSSVLVEPLADVVI